MSARGKKSKPAAKSGILMRLVLVCVLLATLAAAGISFTERRDWPSSLRNHDAVIAVYNTRDKVIDSIWSDKGGIAPLPAKPEAKAPINIRPATKKPEQGYSAKDRAKLEALIEQQGEQP